MNAARETCLEEWPIRFLAKSCQSIKAVLGRGRLGCLTSGGFLETKEMPREGEGRGGQ